MKSIINFVITILLLHFSLIGIAQKTNDNPELVSKAEEIDEKLDRIHFIDQRASRPYIDSLLEMNKTGNCLKCETLGLMYEAFYQSFMGNMDLAIIHIERANQLARKNKDLKNIKASNSYKASFLMDMNKNEEVETFLSGLIEEYKIEKDSIILTSTIYLLGVSLYNQGYFKKSIETFLEAKSYNQTSNPNFHLYNCGIYSDIARSYRELNNYQQSVKYFNDALEFAKKSENEIVIKNVLLNQAINEIELNDAELGLNLLETPLAFFLKINDGYRLHGAYLYKSIALYKLGRYKESETVLLKVFDFYERSNDLIRLSICYSLKSKIQMGLNDYSNALKSSKKAFEIIKELPLQKEKIRVFKNHFDVLYANKEFEKAAQLSILLDSIETEYQKRIEKDNFFELEKKYATEKKEQEINLLKVENELAKKQKHLYIGLLILAIIVGFSLFQLYRNKIKTAEKIKELNEFKSRFFANISHEFRTPLTLIKSPIQSLKSKIKEEEQQKQLALVDQNANRMLELVDQLLELSKLDSNVITLKLDDGNILEFVSTLTEPFAFQANEKKIAFSSQIEIRELFHKYDRDVMQKIITNLLTNALKYTPEDSNIDVFSTIENNQFIFKISNTGVHIKKEEINRLFERFYQKADSHEGVGIGLALVKELVELHQGHINASLENDKLIFEVGFNLSPGNTSKAIEKATERSIIEESDIANELPILLIVDDNKDIRQVIKNLFSNEFKVIEAADGVEGINIAKREIPDCIISDVMMPNMDGFTFTQKIKSDELTSFIPVVLLTAKNTDEAHLEALKSTADTFMTKPFNNDILIANVKQLISERIKLHQRFSQELILKPVDIKINSVDEKFIQKIQSLLETHLSKPDFSAEAFSKQIGMSRMQLHRKLKSLFGITTSEFIRNERLKIAADLLKRDNSSIADIAYSIGFNDVSYFSKCFKDYYGVSPSEFK